MTDLDVEVVLAGGVFRTDDAAFYARLEAGITARRAARTVDQARRAARRRRGSPGPRRARAPRPCDAPDASLAEQLRRALRDWLRAWDSAQLEAALSGVKTKRPRRSGVSCTVPAEPTTEVAWTLPRHKGIYHAGCTGYPNPTYP